ncbi:hypothetical protein LTR37_016215 [Vermiconidia calcicola]|uniref:Uncharacterized protein n=1 Tax=Vermiconidia calcicola TaxID=1690605 RepID=A0ACC3MNU5_9PEZI|nr:hypothetical protein LTR37_016215 [Vermiconidia calcicola]
MPAPSAVDKRVGPKWRATIKGSPNLQKKLFLQPVANSEEARSLGMVEGDDMLQTRLCHRLHGEVTDTELLVNTHVIDLNCTVLNESTETSSTTWTIPRRIRRYIISARRGIASWEQMFITQPPEMPQRFDTAAGHRVAEPGLDASGIALRGQSIRAARRLRGMMDEAGEGMLRKTGWTTDWGRSSLVLWGFTFEDTATEHGELRTLTAVELYGNQFTDEEATSVDESDGDYDQSEVDDELDEDAAAERTLEYRAYADRQKRAFDAVQSFRHHSGEDPSEMSSASDP